jgi:hypothetical protein
LSGLLRNGKDGVMYNVGLIDYSVGGAYWGGWGSRGEGSVGEEDKEKKGRKRRRKEMRKILRKRKESGAIEG